MFKCVWLAHIKVLVNFLKVSWFWKTSVFLNDNHLKVLLSNEDIRNSICFQTVFAHRAPIVLLGTYVCHIAGISYIWSPEAWKIFSNWFCSAVSDFLTKLNAWSKQQIAGNYTVPNSPIKSFASKMCSNSFNYLI